MHTNNARKPQKNNIMKAYSTPRAGAWAGLGQGPGPNWGCCRLALYCFLRFSCIVGMHMPILGWKLVLGWIEFQTYV